MLSAHARERCQARGICHAFLGAILDHADLERSVGGNCRLLRVSRERARELNLGDRLGRYAVIWSEDTARVVTVLPLHKGRSGARYRRAD